MLSIWEGTTNILSLDALRSIQKSNGESIQIFFKSVFKICEQAKLIEPLKDKVETLVKLSNNILKSLKLNDPSELVTGAREFSFTLYRIFTGIFII